ncbi:MAG: hypothetical protein Fur0020_15810 [Thermodesulfovibrionia bacterium]
MGSVMKERIIEGLKGRAVPISVRQERCLRERFYEYKCTACASACPVDAITLEGGIRIDYGLCSECMLCVSSCPSDGLLIKDFNILRIASELRKAQHPVIGCAKDVSLGHVKTYCLGLLSEEDMLALYSLTTEPLQINLTGCSKCKNSHIIPILEKRLHALAQRLSIPVTERVIMVKDLQGLRYKPIGLDRRGFFNAVKKEALTGVAELLLENKESEIPMSEKVLPSKRRLLNKICGILSETLKKRLIENYYFDLSIKDGCLPCGACAGVCPTGALKVEQDDLSNTLLFNSSLCIGCNLCRDICDEHLISINRYISDTSPFDFIEKVAYRIEGM